VTAATDESLPGASAPASCSYELDAQLRLVAVDQSWSDFAQANGAPELVAPAPLGKSILSSITDSTTRSIYAELFTRVAATGRPVTFALRCDSRRLRRFLDLTIEPLPTGFLLTSVERRVEPNPDGDIFQSGTLDDSTLIRSCSWCKQLEADGRWYEIDEAMARLRLFERARIPLVTHAMCDACYQKIGRVLDGLGEGRGSIPDEVV
jgi:hypothetical protein